MTRTSFRFCFCVAVPLMILGACPKEKDEHGHEGAHGKDGHAVDEHGHSKDEHTKETRAPADAPASAPTTGGVR